MLSSTSRATARAAGASLSLSLSFSGNKAVVCNRALALRLLLPPPPLHWTLQRGTTRTFTFSAQACHPRLRNSTSTTRTAVATTTPTAIGSISRNHVTPSSDTTASIRDVFSDPKIMQEASDRWGLGASEYAPIVFPKGRDEIKKKIMDRASTRRSIGYPDRGRISEVEKSTHRHLGDRSSSGGTAKTSTTASSVATKTISLDLRSASSPNPHLHQMSRESSEEKPVPLWMKHQMAIKEKLNGQAWSPQKRVTRKAMDEIRFLHKQFPEEWTTPKLAKHFNIASESVRRILKSNFQISPERAAEQDQIKERIRKEKVKAAVERLAARRHENWKKRQEERQQIRKTATEKERGVIRLGAPKRFFGSS